MKQCLIILFLLVSQFSYSQTWNVLEYDSLKQGLELNPLKGFATLFNPDPNNNFPHSIRGRLFGLDAVMQGPTTFNWEVIDDFLEEQSAIGKHAYIQVNIDPAFGGTHLPDYLFPLVDTFFYDDPNPINPVDDICPDWNDPDLIQAMLTFIDSFGVKYDNDPRIFMIHLGLYGMWGEWHIGDVEFVRPEYAMTEPNKTLIANAYANAFPNTYLLARYPENMPEPQDYGYSDGLFFGQSISPDNPFFFHNTLKDNHADLNWKTYPIGGELDPDLQSTIWEAWPNTVGQDVTASLDSIRPTWIFSHYNFIDQIIEDSEEWLNALRAQREMGYSFYLDSARITAENGNPSIEINMKNMGIAPMYADWNIELAVLDQNNILTSLGEVDWDLHLIQPDILNNYRSFNSSVVLPDGNFTFLIRVINPLEDIPNSTVSPFTFANQTQDMDSLGWLTIGQATILDGNVGTTPTKVTGLTLSHSIDTIERDESLQLLATVLPVDATNSTVTWISSRPNYAYVNEDGLVTPGNAYGTATITAITQDGGFLATCEITFAPSMVPIPALIEAEQHIDAFGVDQGSCCNGVILLENINTNDWMDYGVIVSPSDSIFYIDFRVSSDNANGEISIVDSTDTLTIKNIDNATWWQDYQIRTSDPFVLNSGPQILRLLASSGGFNIDYLEFKTLPNSFTFIGSIDDDFAKGANWDSGTPPPNKYPGLITIAADCKIPIGQEFQMGKDGTLIVLQNVVFTVP